MMSEGSKWRKLTRPRILARDNYRCYICGGPANCVDHLIPRKLTGGVVDVPDEMLRAVCNVCNGRKGAHVRG